MEKRPIGRFFGFVVIPHFLTDRSGVDIASASLPLELKKCTARGN